MPDAITQVSERALPAAQAQTERAAALARRGGGALVLLVYIAATALTDAHNMGDTPHYANGILASGFADLFADFGHLLWPPAGALVARALGPFTGADPYTDHLIALVALGWIAGLGAALLLYDLAYRVARRAWVAVFAAAAFMFSQSFLNYAQTGCSYTAGLFFLLAGLWFLFRDEERRDRPPALGIAAGLAFAGAVALWVPYLLAVPAALAATLLVHGATARRARLAVGAGLAFSIACAMVFLFAAALRGVHDVAGFKEWIAASSHGIAIGGFTRMVFGFARAFIAMGDDGVLFKRYLLHDPYNPVSLMDLFRASLGKLFLVYLCCGIWLAALARDAAGRRWLAFLALSALPVLAFAWHWQGGDLERYFPFYPALFLALAYLLAAGRWRPLTGASAALWLAALVAGNGGVMAKTALAAQQERAVARLGSLQPLWKPQSRIATVLTQDDVFSFTNNFPFHPLNKPGFFAVDRAGRFAAFDIADIGSARTPYWRRTFAEAALSVWSAGGDLWITKRVLAPRPPAAETHWVEGDDPRLPWRDLYDFFSRLEAGAATGGDDGFFLLPPSAANRALLARWENA